MELSAGVFAVELPVDVEAVTIHSPIPGLCFVTQGLEVWDPSGAQTLPREDPDFDFRLIEPTPVDRSVVDGEPIPDFAADFRAQKIRQGFAAMDVQIIHDQMDGLGLHVLCGNFEGHLSELQPRTIRRREGEMAARFGFYRAENTGRPAPLILAIPPCLPSWQCGRGGPQVGVQRDRLLV
jgi:hypothetical protein